MGCWFAHAYKLCVCRIYARMADAHESDVLTKAWVWVAVLDGDWGWNVEGGVWRVMG